MNELVTVKKDDVFTDSMIIAEGTGYTHHAITRKVRDCKKDFEELGKVGYHNQASESGQKTKVYNLNEAQATFLITLLENNKIVRRFKLELVKQFYNMRKLLMEQATTQFKETRQQGKLTRKDETDAIKDFVEYSKAQGSSNAERYYTNFTNLANKAVRVDDRKLMNTIISNNLRLVELVISKEIRNGIAEGKHYKEIYNLCKNRVNEFVSFIDEKGA